MRRIKYLGDVPEAQLKAYGIAPEVNHVIEVEDDLAEKLLAEFPGIFVAAGKRMADAPSEDRARKAPSQNRSKI